MAKALLQNISTTSKILYPAMFSSFTKVQLDELTRVMVAPTRSAKAIGTRLHRDVITNPILGGFINDIHTKVQEAKVRLIDLAQRAGGDTRRSMESLLLRALRRGYEDPTTAHGDYRIPQPIVSRPGTCRHDWWANSVIIHGATSGDHLVVRGLPAARGASPHILTYFPHLSEIALRFLEKFDIGFLPEVVAWTESAPIRVSGPAIWLTNNISPGAQELCRCIRSLLALPDVPMISTVLPIARDQIYQLDNVGHYFRVAGRLASGRISGVYLISGSTRFTRTILSPDPLLPALPQGSGFSTEIDPSTLEQPHVVRVLASCIVTGPRAGSYRLAPGTTSVCGLRQRSLPKEPVIPLRSGPVSLIMSYL